MFETVVGWGIITAISLDCTSTCPIKGLLSFKTAGGEGVLKL
jgi:hypothetical protein